MTTSNIVRALAARPQPDGGVCRVTLMAVSEAGLLQVKSSDGTEFACECLESAIGQSPLIAGDQLLALAGHNGDPGVVLGRLGPYRAPQPQQRLTLEATEVLTLKCGDVSVDLRASDGRLMLRGEDVLLRAKGTQRIKAGSVSIN